MSDAARTPLAVPDQVGPAPSIGGLFMGFFGVGILGFGGVLPLARRMIVDERRWMGAAEFTDLLALCQFLPGGNILNLSVAIGLRFGGLAGAVAAITGLMAAPVVILVLMGMVYARYQDLPLVRGLFAGLAAAAAGLIVATSIKIAAPLRRRPLGIGVALVCFVAIALVRLPLLSVMAVMAPVSIAIAWRWRE
jgi:chromate transporter